MQLIFEKFALFVFSRQLIPWTWVDGLAHRKEGKDTGNNIIKGRHNNLRHSFFIRRIFLAEYEIISGIPKLSVMVDCTTNNFFFLETCKKTLCYLMKKKCLIISIATHRILNRMNMHEGFENHEGRSTELHFL